MKCRYHAIDGILIFSLILFIWPIVLSWDLNIPNGAEFPIFNSICSLRYKISIYCSIAVSIPMLLELCVRVVLEPRLLADFKTFVSNLFLSLSLLLPDLFILILVIPNVDLKLFNLAYEARYVLTVWSLGKFLYRYGDDGIFRDNFAIMIFVVLCTNRILAYYSYYISFPPYLFWLTLLTMFIGFVIYGFKVIKWFRYIKYILKDKSLSTDQYLCNIYIISTTLVYIAVLVLYFVLNPSMSWLQTDVNYLAGSTCIYSAYYILIFVFQGRALQREAVVVKSTLEVKRMFFRYMSHEIRTPLNTVMLGLQFLQEDMIRNRDTLERLSVLEDIKLSCEVATKTLNDMLLYDKIDTGVLKLDRTEVKIVDFIKTTIQPFHIQALQKGINLSMQYVHEGEYQEKIEEEVVDVENIATYERLQALTANIDTNKLAQVIRNLVSNALKFTPRGGAVTVRLYKSTILQQKQQQQQQQNQIDRANRMIAASSDCICMDVIDTGPGISMENQIQLFHGVIQFSPGEMQDGGGSGLGLYISKGIMDAHGGLLRVTSKGIVGHGCTFSIQLPIIVPVLAISPGIGSRPVTDQREADVVNRPVAHSPRDATETNRIPWPRHRLSSIRMTNFDDSITDENVNNNDNDNNNYDGDISFNQVVVEKQRDHLSPRGTTAYSIFSRPKYVRVLVVDDVAMNRKMLLRLLRDRFTSHCEACNGQEAIDKVRDSMITGMTFDVITMDYQMPVMDGTKAAKAIRELGYTGIILGITGNALPEDMKTFMSHGVNEVLTKPIDMATFDNVLLRWTRRDDAFT